MLFFLAGLNSILLLIVHRYLAHCHTSLISKFCVIGAPHPNLYWQYPPAAFCDSALHFIQVSRQRSSPSQLRTPSIYTITINTCDGPGCSRLRGGLCPPVRHIQVMMMTMMGKTIDLQWLRFYPACVHRKHV